VGHEHELRVVLEAADEAHEALHVGVVEGGVHLVEHAERAGLDEVDRKEEGRGREGLLAAGELVERDRPLAARLGDDFDGRVDGVVRILELQLRRRALPEELGEDVAEAVLDLVEGLEEALRGGLVDLLDGLEQGLLRLLQVRLLLLQKVEALLLLLVLFEGERIDVAERVDRAAEALDLVPGRRLVEVVGCASPPPRDARRPRSSG
jgi:hypothetical protein